MAEYFLAGADGGAVRGESREGRGAEVAVWAGVWAWRVEDGVVLDVREGGVAVERVVGAVPVRFPG